MTASAPRDPGFLDEKSVRDELTRAFDICGGCRRCVDRCPVFPSLFDLVDAVDRGGAGLMTPSEQDNVVDRCFHCTACMVDCPYTPDRHELALDIPRLMLRAGAMRRAVGQYPARRRRTTSILGRTSMLGTVPFAPTVTRASRGSFVRRVVQRLTGVSASRALPPHATRRFSEWFAHRAGAGPGGGRRVTVVPTCLVEHRALQIGVDLVGVLERNGVGCAASTMECCGAPWLSGGESARFTEVAERNVRTLAAEVREHGDLVVPEPTCGHVLQQAYVDHVDSSMRSEAEFVARHTYDAADYLMRLHRSDAVGLDTDFHGSVPRSVTHQVGARLRSRGIGRAGPDLLRLTGAEVEVVHQDSADEVMWGLRADNVDVSLSVARRLAARIQEAGGEVVTGDSVLTNTTIEEQTGIRPIHPVELLARAYGLPPEPLDPSR